MISKEHLAQLRELIEAILDERGIKKTPQDISEKRRAAALARWAQKRAADKLMDADASKCNANASTAKPRKQRGSQANAMQLHTSVQTWDAYKAAYQDRYGVEPVRNAQVNSILAKFVKRVPSDEAAAVARFYVAHNQAFYVRAKHPASFLLRDAEGLRTEWATGRSVTDAEAKQVDATAARGNVWGKLIEESREH